MNNSKTLCAALVSAACTSPAFAQSSVTLYGLLDAGITYSNNSGGHSVFKMQDSDIQGDRWGLMGSEDLGGGIKLIFQVENGFSLFTGKLAQGGLEFGRQAFVGVSSDKGGSLTIGRQYDSYVYFIQPITFNGGGGWGILSAHSSDIDNTNDAFRVNNTIKYTSVNYAGLVFGGMYALGGVPGSLAQNSTVAGGLSYSNGGLHLATAYFFAHNPATQFPESYFGPNTNTQATTGAFGYIGQPATERLIGAGGTYNISGFQFGADYTNARFTDALGTTASVIFNDYEVWGNYFITSAFKVGIGYTLTAGSIGYNGDTPKYNQFNFGADYSLSKRTDVYFQCAYQKTSGGANASIYNLLTGTSTTDKQFMARVALRTKF